MRGYLVLATNNNKNSVPTRSYYFDKSFGSIKLSHDLRLVEVSSIERLHSILTYLNETETNTFMLEYTIKWMAE